MELCDLTIHELQDKIRSREISAVAVVESTLRRIEQVEKDLNAYIRVFADEARELAALQDRQISEGKIAALTGIPVALKDLLCTAGQQTTCASKILKDFIPPYDATAVAKLRDAGAIFSGKTNLDEFAMGSSTETSHYGTTRNPWDLSRIPGGSSGGSAAALAAGECVAAIGTDTGGSIRQPAALTGVVGLKPTYGRVSRYGLIAFASSLDQVGTFTRDVEDAAIMLNIIAGHDLKDSTSAPEEVPDYRRYLGRDISGWTIGIPKEYLIEGIAPEVLEALNQTVTIIEGLGARIKPISLPHTDYCVAVYYILAPAEASSNLARYDGIRFGFRHPEGQDLLALYRRSRTEGFGDEVKRRIMLGTYALSAGYYDAYFKKASQVRRLIANDFTAAFGECDAILTPTTPTAAFAIGEKTSDPIQMYLSDIFTISANMAGIPAISIPAGYNHAGLPLGIQFLTPAFAEGPLLQLAYACEKAAPWEKRLPLLTSRNKGDQT